MKITNILKKVINPLKGYSINLLLTNNKYICKREDNNWLQSNFNSAVYLFVKNTNKITNLGWNINIKGSLVYIGFTKIFNKNVLSNRMCKHKNDLLAKILNKNYSCYVIVGLSEYEARSLEAHWIKTSDKPLTKIGSFIFKEGYLINKRRERKWEKLEETYLNIDNQWKSQLIVY